MFVHVQASHKLEVMVFAVLLTVWSESSFHANGVPKDRLSSSCGSGCVVQQNRPHIVCAWYIAVIFKTIWNAVAFLNLDQVDAPLQFVEFFAGKAEATRMFRNNRFKSAKLDIVYMKAQGGGMNPMDLCTDAGFAFLGIVVGSCFQLAISKLSRNSSYFLFIFHSSKPWHTCAPVYFFVALTRWVDLKMLPRLAIATCLLGDYEKGWVSHFGLKCSSWTPVNCGTSQRSPCTPCGFLEYKSVLDGNMLASRHPDCRNLFNVHLFSVGFILNS